MYKKAVSIACVLISLLMLIEIQFKYNIMYYEGYHSSALTAGNPENIILKASEPAENKPLSLHASSACLMDADSGRVLYSKNPEMILPMASTTKIMTCIIALESGRTGETATVSKYAAGMPDVQLNALAGEQYVINDLLYSLMLESHNDTAVIIAEHIGGSVEGFADMMNKKASGLGTANTHFVTPNGLDAKGHFTTAADMCTIASYAIKNPEFLKIIQTQSHSFSDISGKRHYTVNNHDQFLNIYKGAIGIKTGFTGDAGYCFVGAAQRDNVTLTSCVLASGWPPDKSFKWSDTKALMDYGFSHYSYYTFNNETAPIILNPLNVTDGVSPYAMPGLDYGCTALLSESDSAVLDIKLDDTVPAPVHKGQQLGEATVYINDIPYADFPITSKNGVELIKINDIIHMIWDLFIGKDDFYGK